jgi:hypothetical protein
MTHGNVGTFKYGKGQQQDDQNKHRKGAIVCWGCKGCKDVMRGEPEEASYFRVADSTNFWPSSDDAFIKHYCGENCYQNGLQKRGVISLSDFSFSAKYVGRQWRSHSP